MEKIGYIVSKKKIKHVSEFIGVVDDIALADSNKPILIVGLEEARRNTDNFCILEKKLRENVFWTFEKHERRADFEKDISIFNKYIILNILNNINYIYINILLYKYNNIKTIINLLLYSDIKKYIYITNEMIYFYYNNNKIYGISLKILRYAKINIPKLLNKLSRNKSNIIYNDGYYLATKLKKDIGDNNKYIIPYFMSIE